MASAVTFTKIPTNGWEDSLYEVNVFGNKIGEVYSFTNTEVRCTGGRRYGTPVSVKGWEFSLVEGQAPRYQHYTTRRDAVVDLLLASGKVPFNDRDWAIRWATVARAA